VGRGTVAQKAMSPLSAFRSLALEKKEVREEESKDERLVSELGRVSFELAEISTTEGLSKEDIQKAVKQQIPAMELCYQNALEKEPNIQGEATFQLVIGSKGKVTKVNLVSSKLKNKHLEQCIIQKIKDLTFPTPEGTEKVTTTISINLKTS